MRYRMARSSRRFRIAWTVGCVHRGGGLFPHADQLSVAIAPGVPQEMVLRTAREQSSDVIVVGVRRSGKVSRWISGSTTEALLRRSPCSVLTVPEPIGTHRDRRPSSMTATGVVWDPVYLEHVTDDGHPDHPRRLKPLYRRLQDPLVNCRFTTIVPPAATDEEILLVHSPSYLNQVKATATLPASALSADTLTCDRSFPVAAMAVGGTIEAIRQVVAGTLSHALVLARPPGHHAERTRAMGYCIFNNVAIGSMAARTAMGLARVMVVDWDLHHGNGTQHIFERDPSVFFFSSHQFPHYPGTGHFTETGQGPGEGTTMNVPLSRGCGDGEFAAIYQRLLTPVVRAFEPQLIRGFRRVRYPRCRPAGRNEGHAGGIRRLDPTDSGRCPADLRRSGGFLPGGGIRRRRPGRLGPGHDR